MSTERTLYKYLVRPIGPNITNLAIVLSLSVLICRMIHFILINQYLGLI